MGARIAQAFSATDPSVEVEEIIRLHDIPRGSSGPQCMSDGVGTMSRQFANEVWEALESKRHKRRHRKNRPAPSAYQVRYQGAKGMHCLAGRNSLTASAGMLSIDYTLK